MLHILPKRILLHILEYANHQNIDENVAVITCGRHTEFHRYYSNHYEDIKQALGIRCLVLLTYISDKKIEHKWILTYCIQFHMINSSIHPFILSCVLVHLLGKRILLK